MLKIATVVFWSALSLGVDATEPKSAATYEPPAQQEANKTESPKQPPEAPKEDASNATPKREQEQHAEGENADM